MYTGSCVPTVPSHSSRSHQNGCPLLTGDGQGNGEIEGEKGEVIAILGICWMYRAHLWMSHAVGCQARTDAGQKVLLFTVMSSRSCPPFILLPCTGSFSHVADPNVMAEKKGGYCGDRGSWWVRTLQAVLGASAPSLSLSFLLAAPGGVLPVSTCSPRNVSVPLLENHHVSCRLLTNTR